MLYCLYKVVEVHRVLCYEVQLKEDLYLSFYPSGLIDWDDEIPSSFHIEQVLV